MNEGLQTVMDYLTNVPAWYLATSVDGQPHVRPFSFVAFEDGRLWFCTAKTKDVYQELEINPRFEATSWWVGHGWLILRGVADLDDRVGDETRRAGFEHLTALGETYDGPDDPVLTFFAVDKPRAWICNHTGTWDPIAL